jgi:hypothetical protein
MGDGAKENYRDRGRDGQTTEKDRGKRIKDKPEKTGAWVGDGGQKPWS